MSSIRFFSVSQEYEYLLPLLEKEKNVSRLVCELLLRHYKLKQDPNEFVQDLESQLEKKKKDLELCMSQIEQKSNQEKEKQLQKEQEEKAKLEKAEKRKLERIKYFMDYGSDVYGVDKQILEMYIEDYINSELDIYSYLVKTKLVEEKEGDNGTT